MKIDFTKATFLLSVANLQQLPHDSGIEVAFAGRSNAGKSTALNMLTKNKYLAKTSKTPGRTQLINFFGLDNDRRLVDLPGYGYAKVALDVKNRWQETLSEYLQTRDALRGIVLLMDIRHPLKDYDCHMIEWSVHANIPIHILLTKADKLTRNHANKVLQQVKKELSDIPNVSIQLFSALNNMGVDDFRGKLNEWFDQ